MDGPARARILIAVVLGLLAAARRAGYGRGQGDAGRDGAGRGGHAAGHDRGRARRLGGLTRAQGLPEHDAAAPPLVRGQPCVLKAGESTAYRAGLRP
jgi:hypothetical protein